jgi:hypothetical protein
MSLLTHLLQARCREISNARWRGARVVRRREAGEGRDGGRGGGEEAGGEPAEAEPSAETGAGNTGQILVPNPNMRDTGLTHELLYYYYYYFYYYYCGGGTRK